MGTKIKRDSPAGYSELLGEVQDRIRSAHYDALLAVKKKFICRCWDIGKLIEQRKQGVRWGNSMGENLARDLRQQFPGMRGWSRRNVFYMQRLYLAYRDNEKVQPLVA